MTNYRRECFTDEIEDVSVLESYLLLPNTSTLSRSARRTIRIQESDWSSDLDRISISDKSPIATELIHEFWGDTSQSWIDELRATLYSAIGNGEDQLRIRLRVVKALRRYKNSLADTQDSFFVEWRAEVSFSDIILRDGGRLLSPMMEMISRSLYHSCMLLRFGIDQLAANEVSCSRIIPQTASLLISPNVAAVLLHEVIGHAVESFIPALNWRVGGEWLQVFAIHPRRYGLDDDGVPIGRIPVVKNGTFVASKYVGERAHTHRNTILERCGGLSQVSLHGENRRLRCTHLEVVGGDGDARSLVKTFEPNYYCQNVVSGCHFLGEAKISVSGLVDCSTGLQVAGPVEVTWVYGRTSIVGASSYGHRTRGGVCLINGTDPLPTEGSFPWLMIQDAEINGTITNQRAC